MATARASANSAAPVEHATSASARAGVSPVVSLGLPVYNGASHLREALDSLLAQTFADFELIISDNASTDSTAEICADYARRDRRVRYFRQSTNVGAARNWNFVVHEARGQYFKWASANDTCEPTFLTRCVQVMEAERAVVLCYGATRLMNGSGTTLEVYRGDVALCQEFPRQRYTELRTRLALNNAQSGLIRTKALRRTRLVRPYFAGDLALMAELVLQGKFHLLQEPLLNRRVSEGSFSSLLSVQDLVKFWDPTSSATARLDLFRLHLDHVATVVRARVPPGEKLACLLFALRAAYWDHRALWRELRSWFAGRMARRGVRG